MTRIEQEKRIVRKMIELYCRHHLHQDTMPDEYLHLADFACRTSLVVVLIIARMANRRQLARIVLPIAMLLKSARPSVK